MGVLTVVYTIVQRGSLAGPGFSRQTPPIVLLRGMAEDYANDSLDHSNTLHEMWHAQLPAFDTVAPIGTVGYLIV